jgi:hypothetical protein
VRGHSGQVESAGVVLDEHQHIQPPQEHRLHHQEVTGDDRVSLGGQELPPGRPGPPRRGIGAGGVQDLPYGGRGDRIPSRGSSPWILLCPQVGFSRAIHTINVLIEIPVDGRVGAEYSATLCDLGVFVDEPAEPVSSDDPHVSVDRVG